MSIPNQKHLFNLPSEVTYLNGAYMSPQLKTVEAVGIDYLKKKGNPSLITVSDFFSEKEVLRSRFAQLIEADDAQRIAIIPSVSFGMATAMRNIAFEKGDEIIVLEEQFPSNFYVWKQLETEVGVVVKTITAPPTVEGRGARWNEAILEAITNKTKCIAIPYIHWADGTLFDVKAIRFRSLEVGAYLIIDGTQSVGALPFSVKQIRPDALICAGYKWLMGAYGLGVAYFGERFDHGTPLDNNWMNHEGAEDFTNLVRYNLNYKAKGARYDVGESSNFILVPMLSEGIKQLLEWRPAAIQEYCKEISHDGLKELKAKGYFIEESSMRAAHLFGIYTKKAEEIALLKEKIASQNIFVSYRGTAIRVAPNCYNTKEEVEKLISCFP